MKDRFGTRRGLAALAALILTLMGIVFGLSWLVTG
jgi:hypothetical protein